METFAVALVLINVLFLTANGNLCTDDVIAKLVNKIDALQDVVHQQQKEIQLLTQKQTQNERDADAERIIENGDDVPNNRRKRQLPNEGTVAFTAVLKHPVTNLGLQQNVVFDTVETNVGNAYNPHHGTFVAPVSGIYVIHTTMFAHRNQLAFCRIAVNGVNKADVYVQASTTVNSGSQLIVTQLNKGDDVAVQAMSVTDTIYSDGNIYVTFSGFLLQDLSDMGEIIG